MARVKISEYRAKKIIYSQLGLDYVGLCIDASNIDNDALEELISKYKSFVVKVDQAVKKRNKSKLVFLDVPPRQVKSKINEISKKGFKWLLVEPFIKHSASSERFVAIERGFNDIKISYSSKGGVDIEENKESVINKSSEFPHELKLLKTKFEDANLIKNLLDCFEKSHISYLEINPYIMHNNKYLALDAAVEVDSSAEFFVNELWSSKDFRIPKQEMSDEEKFVEALSSKTPSSLSLRTLNKNGSIFLLLSGGGASIVILDELSAFGFQDEIGNYGEYSGNPSEEEVYLYSKQVLKLLLSSKAPRKVFLIAGAVANFTDISKTFNGITRAFEDHINEILSQDIVFLVRRGGPNQAHGLKAIDSYFQINNLKGEVYGPEISLAKIVTKATERFTK